MKTEVREVSAVVVAEEHNPSILHPLFLEGQGIVPRGWEIEEGPVCNPLVSTVKYRTGIRFTMDRNRLTVQHEAPSTLECRVAELAAACVKALPHVRYTAVGLNFGMAVFMELPVEFLLERFVHRGSLAENGMDLRSASLNVTFELEDALLNLSLVPRPRDDEKGATPALLVRANYHHEIDAKPGAVKVVTRALDTCPARARHFESLVQKLTTGRVEQKS